VVTTPDSIGRLAADVRARRRDLGLGQEELADLSGTSARWIRDVEHGRATVRLDKLAAVLDALGLELHTRLRRGSGDA
jgi:HTH-type transcriptional regulator / antitoxin HipB